MNINFSGHVYFANGDPAAGIRVRIFDRDAAGKEDDDLTVSPGISDEKGAFSVTYEPLRYLDFHTHAHSSVTGQPAHARGDEHGLRIPDLGDVYLPYLQFEYLFNHQHFTHTAAMGIFQDKFYLPEYPAVEFRPSVHAFKFKNKFRGYFLPFSTPAFMSTHKVSSQYGLCGGMCAAAYDFALAGIPVPDTTESPRQGSRLHRYLFQRQMDSLGGLGQGAIKVAQWTSLPDDTSAGTLRRTADMLPAIFQKLDKKNLVVLAVIYAHATSLGELSRVIFNNHQVLAYAYQKDAAGVYTINIYDPNLPGREDVEIRCEPVWVGNEGAAPAGQPVFGVRSAELLAGDFYKPIRGFFSVPYEPVRPPEGM